MIQQLQQQIHNLQQQLANIQPNIMQSVKILLNKAIATTTQAETLYGVYKALCVSTDDPQGEGRIRFYSPMLMAQDSPVESLPWAYPISALGGFDDCGALWVPPAGSVVMILYENGDRRAPHYIGTVWTRDRGLKPRAFGFGVPEFDKYHEGHRTGYLFGSDNGDQVFPPSNTENYNIKDYDNIDDFERDPLAGQQISPSNIYMMKTPQKHRLKFVDGHYKCNFRWKRVELGSSCGHIFMMCDDKLHPAGQWANPNGGCGVTSEDASVCADSAGEALEDEESQRNTGICANKFFKQKGEMRAFRGPGTPMNNRCTLEQTGIFLSSISGHIFVMDDSVSEPQGKPTHESATKNFDFGAEDKFTGKMYMVSTTGHEIMIGDEEDGTNLRSDDFNGIRLTTATGNKIEMNDHTLKGGIGGFKRGIFVQSTSNHGLLMVDEGNEQASPDRRSGGVPTPKSKEAYVWLKTGYGMHLLMRDDHSQEHTEAQFLEILAPQKDNTERGPHIMRMQEAPQGTAGIVLLRVGGIYVISTFDDSIESVGSEDNPSDKITLVSNDEVSVTKQAYVHLSDIEYHFAEKFIIMAAGHDGPDVNHDGIPDPNIYSVILAMPTKDAEGKQSFFVCPFTGYPHVGLEQSSNRFFASSKQNPPLFQ